MAWLYSSTDSRETLALSGVLKNTSDIIKQSYHSDFKFTATDLDYFLGEHLKIRINTPMKRINFNPMSSIHFEEITSITGLEKIAAKLASEGLFVATESDSGLIRVYTPEVLYGNTFTFKSAFVHNQNG